MSLSSRRQNIVNGLRFTVERHGREWRRLESRRGTPEGVRHTILYQKDWRALTRY